MCVVGSSVVLGSSELTSATSEVLNGRTFGHTVSYMKSAPYNTNRPYLLTEQ